MSHLTTLHGHEIEQKSEAWRFSDFLQPCFWFFTVLGLIKLRVWYVQAYRRARLFALPNIRGCVVACEVTFVACFCLPLVCEQRVMEIVLCWPCFGAASRPQHVGPNSKNKHLGVELVPQCEDFNEEHVELAQTHSQRKLNPSLPDFPPPFHLPSPLFSPILCSRLSSTMG